jgi:hypothetical protein
LLNFQNGSTQAALLSSLEKMRSFKPVANWPVMAVSKVLRFYNPELFPIYDNEVIWNKVLKRFRHEFKTFCYVSSPPYDVGDTPTFYRIYIRRGAALLKSGYPRFMETFAVTVVRHCVRIHDHWRIRGLRGVIAIRRWRKGDQARSAALGLSETGSSPDTASAGGHYGTTSRWPRVMVV